MQLLQISFFSHAVFRAFENVLFVSALASVLPSAFVFEMNLGIRHHISVVVLFEGAGRFAAPRVIHTQVNDSLYNSQLRRQKQPIHRFQKQNTTVLHGGIMVKGTCRRAETFDTFLVDGNLFVVLMLNDKINTEFN
jgi:hypothetical protein